MKATFRAFPKAKSPDAKEVEHVAEFSSRDAALDWLKSETEDAAKAGYYATARFISGEPEPKPEP